ncbi:MAG: hypothetical protein HYS14_06170 [Candidatus Rokubacteria bacterium]|nr:hypothetical protein [Candidatus Rokubacteria bacterium]
MGFSSRFRLVRRKVSIRATPKARSPKYIGPDEGQGQWERGPTEGGAEDLPERWSAQRKTALVLRLLRGEPLDAVSRESQVPAHELESWKRSWRLAAAG